MTQKKDEETNMTNNDLEEGVNSFGKNFKSEQKGCNNNGDLNCKSKDLNKNKKKLAIPEVRNPTEQNDTENGDRLTPENVEPEEPKGVDSLLMAENGKISAGKLLFYDWILKVKIRL